MKTKIKFKCIHCGYKYHHQIHREGRCPKCKKSPNIYLEFPEITIET